MSEQEITQEQEVAVVPGTETSSEIVASSNTQFQRTDDVYLEASTTPTPTPPSAPDVTPEADLAPPPGAPITVEDITLSEDPETDLATAPVAEQGQEQEQEQEQPETPPVAASQTETAQQTEPEQPQSLLEWGFNAVSSLCTKASDYCNEVAQNNEGTWFGTVMGWASWGFSSVSSIVDTVSSWFSDPSSESKEQQMDDDAFSPSAQTTSGSPDQQNSQDVASQEQVNNLEAADHLILKNERIKKLRELLDQLHQALEEYRAQHEEREEQEEEQEIEDYHQQKEELVEVVKEIQDLVPVDAPEIREALETYRIEAYRDDLPKDMVYQNIMEIVNDLMEREEREEEAVTA